MKTCYALTTFILLFRVVLSSTSDNQCLIEEDARVDCYPYDVATPLTCAARDCCWHVPTRKSKSNDTKTPWCFHPIQPIPSPSVCSASPLALRLDCWDAVRDGGHATPETCNARGCCWTPVIGSEGEGVNLPWCHHPGGYGAYTVKRTDTDSNTGTVIQRLTLPPQTLTNRGPTRHEPIELSAQIDLVGPIGIRFRLSDPNTKKEAWSLAKTPLGIPHVPSTPSRGTSEVQINVSEKGESFSLGLERKGETIVSTHGAISAAPSLAEISLSLPPTAVLHGLGEHVSPWALGTRKNTGAGYVYTIWTRDRGTPDAGPNGNSNLYGAWPLLVWVDTKDGTTGAAFFASSAAMDVTLHSPVNANEDAKYVTFRAAGGLLDMFIYSALSFDALLPHVHALFGLPALPPRWALGFQICRWGYESLNQVKEMQDALIAANIPTDVFWLDIDYMDKYRIFTTQANFPAPALKEWSNQLHINGSRFVIINDPGIASGYARGEYPAFDEALAANVLIRKAKKYQNIDDEIDLPALGHVWPGETAFADFTAGKPALDWWRHQITAFRDKIGFDGLWLDMGEISNFYDSTQEALERRKAVPSPEPPYNDVLLRTASNTKPRPAALLPGADVDAFLDYTWPPFLPGRRGGAQMLEEKTLPTASLTNWGPQYFTHSLFGLLEARATATVLRDATHERPFIISRSTFPGQGVEGGHWLGDNTATWHDLKLSLPGVFNFHMFGVPLVGTDLCGFAGAASSGGATGVDSMIDERGLDTELCARWYQLGSTTYTFFRVHTMAGRPHQHPAVFTSRVTDVMRAAIRRRLELVPYLYTLMRRASVDGGAVVIRPLSFDFLTTSISAGDTSDALTLASLDTQAMIGNALLTSPILESAATSLRAFFPRHDSWFDWISGAVLIHDATSTTPTSWTTLEEITLETSPLHIRGGYIVPSATNDHLVTSRAGGSLILTAALRDGAYAEGELWWDDGVSLDWAKNGALFSFHTETTGGGSAGTLVSTRILGPRPAALVSGDDPCVDRIRIMGIIGAPHTDCQAFIIRPPEFEVPPESKHCIYTNGVLTISMGTCEALKDGITVSWTSPNDEL